MATHEVLNQLPVFQETSDCRAYQRTQRIGTVMGMIMMVLFAMVVFMTIMAVLVAMSMRVFMTIMAVLVAMSMRVFMTIMAVLVAMSMRVYSVLQGFAVDGLGYRT